MKLVDFDTKSYYVLAKFISSRYYVLTTFGVNSAQTLAPKLIET